MGRLTLNDLTKVLIEKNGLDKDRAQTFLNTVFDTVMDGLQRDRQVKVKGLGTFKVVEVEARESVHINTGERLLISGHSKITFTPDATMKELVNKPFSSFETVILNDGVSFDDLEGSTPATDTESNEAIETVSVEPATEEPKVEQAIVEEPKEEVTLVEEPKEEVTLVEEPKEEITLAEETKAEETKLEEPAEPVVTEEQQEDVPVSPTNETITFLQVSDDSEDNEDSDEIAPFEKPKERKWLWPVAFVLGCIVSFVLGYHASKVFDPLRPYQDIDTVLVESIDDSDSVAVADTLAKDTLAKDTLAAAAQTEPAEEAEDYRKYEMMDARVRTGAYRIVGTDRVVKSTPGETLGYISGHYLGPDMVCYVEVYNGIKDSHTALEAGTEIKIPKLELKKKAKKKQQSTNN